MFNKHYTTKLVVYKHSCVQFVLLRQNLAKFPMLV